MFKKVLVSFVGISCLCVPTGDVNALTTSGTSGITVELSGGSAGFDPASQFNSATLSGNIEDDNDNGRIKLINDTYIGFGVIDMSGTHSGWSVSVSSSDFTRSKDGKVVDRFSNHNGTFKIDCGSTANQFFTEFRNQTHVVCKNSAEVQIASSGTSPVTLAQAPADSTSADSHWFNLPGQLFQFSFDSDITAGSYKGEIVFDFSKAP